MSPLDAEAQAILTRAREREAARPVARIDYERMNREWPKQKAALTRAKNTADPDARRANVLKVCASAVKTWDDIGAWPDDWSLFQRTLDDTFPVFHAPRLEDLR